MLPRGNTWTCEASHEFSNVNGERNLEFWFEARRRGSPLKIFPQPGSAVPPTAYEWGGGWYGGEEQARFMGESLMVTGLDEVMDWPAVWNPDKPSYQRLWGMIGATFAARGVVEGHASGLRDLPAINAFAAAGLASVREVRVLGAVGVVELDRPVDVPAVTRAALDAGVWVRPFRNLLYTMPPFVATADDLATITAGIVGAVKQVHG